MNVLSVFDGMSGGQLALQKAGIRVDNYFAAEIDKYASQVTSHRFPDTIQLGDVTKVSASGLPKIDLLIGGSPCQGFSFAGKQLNFDDPRSKLFFEFVRLLEEIRETNPDVKFMLENVKMKKEYQDVITSYLGVEPVQINSALVSAQNRVRLYWTNIGHIEQPEDLGILLQDIVIDGHVDRDKAYCVDANYAKGGNPEQYFNKSRRQLIFDRPCTLREYKESSLCHHAATALDIKGNESIKRVYAIDGKAPALTTMQGGHREPKILCVPEATKVGFTEIYPDEGVDLTFPTSKTRRGRAMRTKSNCLTATTFDYGMWDGHYYRKLTPLECERLQTVPDDYSLILDDNGKQLVSNSQRYKMLGNGWTIDVIAHIFKGLKENHGENN